jgi:hypothetical protein
MGVSKEAVPGALGGTYGTNGGYVTSPGGPQPGYATAPPPMGGGYAGPSPGGGYAGPSPGGGYAGPSPGGGYAGPSPGGGYAGPPPGGGGYAGICVTPAGACQATSAPACVCFDQMGNAFQGVTQ